MSVMTEVLAAHQEAPGRKCRCGFDPRAVNPLGGWGQAMIEHQSAMLTAAGFGPVKERKRA